MLFDFSNRGGRGAFTRLNDGGGSDLSKESYAGKGFLNRHDYSAGVNLPRTPSRLPYWNYGPDFDEGGIMSVFPPAAVPRQGVSHSSSAGRCRRQ